MLRVLGQRFVAYRSEVLDDCGGFHHVLLIEDGSSLHGFGMILQPFANGDTGELHHQDGAPGRLGRYVNHSVVGPPASASRRTSAAM